MVPVLCWLRPSGPVSAKHATCVKPDTVNCAAPVTHRTLQIFHTTEFDAAVCRASAHKSDRCVDLVKLSPCTCCELLQSWILSPNSGDSLAGGPLSFKVCIVSWVPDLSLDRRTAGRQFDGGTFSYLSTSHPTCSSPVSARSLPNFSTGLSALILAPCDELAVSPSHSQTAVNLDKCPARATLWSPPSAQALECLASLLLPIVRISTSLIPCLTHKTPVSRSFSSSLWVRADPLC